MDPKFLKPYNPAETEERIYKRWEESGFFNPDICMEKGVTKPDAEPFSIVLPPPNVTGTLHLGHAAMLAIEDILVRFNRMRGKRTLWVPGTDHAAIATQSKVESEIYKKEKKNRHDLGREKFLKRVEEFAQKSHDTIVHQLKKMGSSLDWSREAFTLDEKRSLAVHEAFKRMYDAGLIYRGSRIVNWDPKLQTTVSDDEIVWTEEKAPFYYLKYGPFVIGTSRPETKFGDKYVVMHPDDSRYKEYTHGQKIELEWINGPVTATVIKDEAVDKEFGTGVMTITPWHDATDFEIAERHALDKEQVIDERGKLLSIAGEFAGMKIRDARAKIIEKLQAKGLVDRIDENYTHRTATNDRGGGSIEPQIKEQWFVAVNKPFTLPHSGIKGIPAGQETTLKEIMRKAVEGGQIKIIPKYFSKTYFHWIDNLRDWCISRQIWYGHRIPVWYQKESGIRNQELKVWNLKIYGQDIFDSIANSTKKIEVRAGRERGEEKYWGDMRPGDIVEFQLANEKTDKVIENVAPLKKVVGEVLHFQDLATLWKTYKAGDDYPGKSIEEVEAWWRARPPLFERIKRHGVWAINLESEPKIYIGVEAPEGEGWEQDPDTLDTWFSSGLWTCSTLGWPAFAEIATAGKPGPENDLANYHPTSILETGYDILFFWVARMILMTGFFLGDVPFRTVYLHGLVRDAKGRKMSKSIGNIIDPLDMIAKYGADATRLSLVIGTAPGTDSKLSEDKIKGYKNFSNKIWNIARFVLSNTGPEQSTAPQLTKRDTELKKELDALVSDVTKDMEEYRLYMAGEKIYHYVWHAFADAILEERKPILTGIDEAVKQSRRYLLMEILTTSLKLLHPFMPFVTEEIWSHLPRQAGLPKRDSPLLMIASWPK